MEVRFLPDQARTSKMTSADLRASFLIETLFRPGRADFVYFDLDRAVVGSAVPTDRPLALATADPLRATYFCERREVGVINVGGAGRITTDGRAHGMGPRECLYIGRGTREVAFESTDAAAPAAFFLVSFPAHAPHPTTHARVEDARRKSIGATEDANRRHLHQYIHMEGVKSCQLVMGFTELESGSVWNTMPPHTHHRRCEIYLYFDLPEEHRVLHLMGLPQETRPLWIANRQVVVSPAWSMHFGAGTHNYRFVWAMGGENQAFDDMDFLAVTALR